MKNTNLITMCGRTCHNILQAVNVTVLNIGKISEDVTGVNLLMFMKMKNCERANMTFVPSK